MSETIEKQSSLTITSGGKQKRLIGLIDKYRQFAEQCVLHLNACQCQPNDLLIDWLQKLDTEYHTLFVAPPAHHQLDRDERLATDNHPLATSDDRLGITCKRSLSVSTVSDADDGHTEDELSPPNDSSFDEWVEQNESSKADDCQHMTIDTHNDSPSHPSLTTPSYEDLSVSSESVQVMANTTVDIITDTQHDMQMDSDNQNGNRKSTVGHNNTNHNNNNTKESAMKLTDTKSKELLSEMALNESAVSVCSDADSIVLSHPSDDYAAKAETAFKWFTEYIGRHRAKQRLFEQLSQLEFPIFLYIFIELFECGHKVSARRFLRDHKSRFKELSEMHAIDLMNKSLNTMSFESSLQKYKTSKYCIKISDKCLEQMKRHLKDTNDLIIVDIINKSIDFNLYSTHNQNQPEMTDKRVDKCSQFIDTESLPVSDDSFSQTHSKDVEEFMQCVERLKKSGPYRPPIRTFTVNSEDVCCAAITDDMGSLALGFTDSRICLKKFGQKFSNESRFDLKRNVSDIWLNLVEHDMQTIDDNDADDNYCQTSSAATNCDTNSSAATDQDSYRILRAHSGPVLGLAFSANDILLSCSTDTTVRAWDATSGHNVAIYNNHKRSVWALDTAPIGNMFCTAGDECVAYLWSLDNSQPLRMFVTNFSCVYCVRFHRNCKYLAMAEKEITLWDIDRAQEVRTLVGHESIVNSMSFSSCGRYLASAGEDRKVILWDIDAGRPLKVFAGHTNSVYSVCFDDNNTLLSSGGADHTLRLWNVKKYLNQTAEDSSPIVTNTDVNHNTSHVESDQFMSYQMNANVIHTQFMPRNLLLTIGKKS